MKNCPVCQKLVSDFAVECPHCNAKMNVEVQKVEVVSEAVPPKANPNVKPDYLSIILLSLIIFFLQTPINYVRTISGGNFFGDAVLVANTAIGYCLHPIALAVFTALLVCVAMRFYHRQGASIRVFSILSLSVIAIFGLLELLLTQIITPQLFVNDTMIVEMAKKALPSAILFNAILYPGYVLISYWGIHALGRKKGYIASAIGALLLLVIVVLTSPLAAVMKLVWTTMYFFAFPVLAYLLYVGVLFIFQITGRRTK